MIYVVTHKDFEEANLGPEYKVIHVGASDSKKSYLRDDVLDNISEKNPNYCELTGLYWIWKNEKNEKNDITGLVHYRRYFTTTKEELLYTYFNITPSRISYDSIKKTLKKHDIILPKPEQIFRTVKQYYADEHYEDDLEITRNVIKTESPEYLNDFDKVMNQHYFYYGNMMIAKRELFDDYCEWLFKILFEVEKNNDISKYKDNYQKRVYGFLSERLLQVWVVHKNIKVKTFPVYNTESRRMTFFKKNYNRIIHALEKVYS